MQIRMFLKCIRESNDRRSSKVALVLLQRHVCGLHSVVTVFHRNRSGRKKLDGTSEDSTKQIKTHDTIECSFFESNDPLEGDRA